MGLNVENCHSGRYMHFIVLLKHNHKVNFVIMLLLLYLPYQFLTVLISVTVKILKIGTPEIITIIVLQLEQLDFTVQYCVQKMQTE